MSTNNAQPEWAVRRERSSSGIIRLMVWISLHLGRPFGRLILHGIAAYVLAFAPAARRASRQYLARALGRPPQLHHLYLHFFHFSSTLHDRIYLLNDRFDLFDIDVVGESEILSPPHLTTGIILAGAHLGSFEALRALSRKHARLDITVAMYQDNSRKFNDILAAINPAAAQKIISLARFDSMLKIKECLDHGESVGMLGDRTPKAEGMTTRNFLGTPAPFPTGTFRLAALLRKPVYFMAGLYLGGNRYRIHFELIHDFSSVKHNERPQAIEQALDAYVVCLERHCRQTPYNWFNVYDFWAQPGPSASG